MKKTAKILMLSAALSFAAVVSSQAQVSLSVRVRPHRPVHTVIVRPERPSPRHVWVEEEWTPNGTKYDYHPGYWAEPGRPGAVWVRGHWRHSHRGYVWQPGHWNR